MGKICRKILFLLYVLADPGAHEAHGTGTGAPNRWKATGRNNHFDQDAIHPHGALPGGGWPTRSIISLRDVACVNLYAAMCAPGTSCSCW
jgi:hypothetical protein